MTSTVIFDVGNVLLRWEPSRLADAILGDDHPAEERRAVAALASTPLWKEFDCGLTPEQFVARVEPASLRPAARRFVREFAACMPRVEHGESLLRRVREGGRHRLVVLSNFPAAPYASAEAANPDLFSAFSGATVSGRVGVAKPARAVFDRVLADHGLGAPGGCVFIDDRPENVEAARAAGLSAVLYDDAEPDRVERELAALGVL